MSGLNIGTAFPAITADTVDGGSFTIPTDLAGGPAIILFYRGHW